jgi:hypothetical protein
MDPWERDFQYIFSMRVPVESSFHETGEIIAVRVWHFVVFDQVSSKGHGYDFRLRPSIRANLGEQTRFL